METSDRKLNLRTDLRWLAKRTLKCMQVVKKAIQCLTARAAI